MVSTLRFKSWIASTACALGAFQLSAFSFREKATVFMYHRILEPSTVDPTLIQPGMYVLPQTFRSHIQFLKENFHILSLSELVGFLDNKKSVNGCCAITFDDGWLDNYVHAFPVLKEFKVPATIFLATGFIGTDRLFWPDELAFYLRQSVVRSSIEQNKEFERILNRANVKHDISVLIENAIMELKSWPIHEREDFFSYLRTFGKERQHQRLLMNWNEASKMQESGFISFGAHTSNHVILDQVPLQQAEEEIFASHREILNYLGVAPEFFSYPNGNFTPEVKGILRRLGFKGAVATRKGWVGTCCDPFEIPRIGMHEDVSRTIPLFMARVFFRCF
jgi:peptidoglycan/xylan/chitin deacetylase (PgdA/CDA1 family)